MRIDNKFAVFVLIEILYIKGLINKATYYNVEKYKRENYTFYN